MAHHIPQGVPAVRGCRPGRRPGPDHPARLEHGIAARLASREAVHGHELPRDQTASAADDATALEESFAMLDVMRRFLSRRSAEAVMLGEVNLPYDELEQFFGGTGQRMTMAFDFPLNQNLYLALARMDTGPLREVLAERAKLSSGKSWGLFVRNHDELTLDQLSESERGEVFEAFGPDPDVLLPGQVLRAPPAP